MDYSLFLDKCEKEIGEPIDNKIPVILASASPRRRELINLIIKNYKVKVSRAEETVPGGMAASCVPEYLAQIKAEAVAAENQNGIVIGCDTVVILDGQILGKPKDKSDALRMLKELSNNTHTVMSGVCIIYQSKMVTFSDTTRVTFRELNEDEIISYVDSAEPMDKAGGYGIQGEAGRFVSNISGSCYNVIGFPILKIRECLLDFFR